MKFLRGLLLYAAVIFVGGTMQQVMTIPYQNPIKDGHEFTRDLMAGVVQKTAIEDVFAGIPMFQRYDNVFNFQDAVSSDLSKITDNAVVKYDYNKVREIAWLPALSFSAEAGELEQFVFEYPVETFDYIGEARYEYKSELASKPTTLLPIGVGYSDENTYVFFRGKSNYDKPCHYINEETGALVAVDKLPDGTSPNVNHVMSYGGRIFLIDSPKIYEFKNGALVLIDDVERFETSSARFAKLTEDRGYFDLETNKIVQDDDRVLNQYRSVFRTEHTPRFGGTSVPHFVSINPKNDPQSAAMELVLGGRLGERENYIRSTNGIGDITYSEKTGTYWASFLGNKRSDTGASSGSTNSSSNLRNAARSHNYFYHGIEKSDGFYIKKYQIRIRYDDKGRDRFVYGDKKHIERSRPWQQTN